MIREDMLDDGRRDGVLQETPQQGVRRGES